MTLYYGQVVFGGGNISVDPSLYPKAFSVGGCNLRIRNRHLYKLNYTPNSSDYGVQWHVGNVGMMPNEPYARRPHANRANWQSGSGMFIRMVDEDNYYVAYTFNDYRGADLTKGSVSGAGEGFYVDKVVAGVTTNLYHFHQVLPYDQEGQTPIFCGFSAVGSTLTLVCGKYSINWSTTDSSLSAIGNAGLFFMDWNMIPHLSLEPEV